MKDLDSLIQFFIDFDNKCLNAVKIHLDNGQLTYWDLFILDNIRTSRHTLNMISGGVSDEK